MRDPHQNIFWYYRSQTKDKETDLQIENNATKALINLLEYSEPEVIESFLQLLKIHPKIYHEPKYLLQRKRTGSIPDAEIRLENGSIVYIESKVKASLNIKQLEEHLKAIKDKDYLVYISNNSSDFVQVKKLSDKIITILWKAIHHDLTGIKTSDKKTNLLLEQFKEFLEVMNLTNFIGFKDIDFDYFVNHDDTYGPLLKDKLANLLTEISEKLIQKGYPKFQVYGGKLSEKDNSCWSSLVKNKKGFVNTVHFTVSINLNQVNLFLNLEGLKLVKKSLNLMKEDKNRVHQLFLSYQGYDLNILKRCKIRASKYISETVVEFRLKEKILRLSDVEYIIDKMESLINGKENCYPRLMLKIVIKRGDPKLKSEVLVQELTQKIVNLKAAYDYFKEAEIRK
ncbi:hypothetical protein HYY74_04720 [Candidatus Woesearchaeota archaeon]|nr:hypothetical protein [Candidatus Woesearchaeota archaeon]